MGGRHSFLNNLEWRRAEKHFGDGEVEIDEIIEAIIAVPTSFGLQPFKVYAIQNKAIKESLKAASFGQAQVAECHTLFVFCARTDLEARAEEYIKAASAEGWGDMIRGTVKGASTEWAIRQAYIALGFGLAACAELQIASCPMEGFQASEVAKILSLPDTLVPCVYLAVGEAVDDAEHYERFRFPESDLIVKLI
jgi:nitroreductase